MRIAQEPISLETPKVLRTPTPREEQLLKMRFGVGDGAEHTLEEVGRSFNVTRERIRQIESKALRKLRHPSRFPWSVAPAETAPEPWATSAAGRAG